MGFSLPPIKAARVSQENLCVEDPGPVEVEHGETPLLGGHRVVGRPIALDTVALPNTSGACLYKLRESDGA